MSIVIAPVDQILVNENSGKGKLVHVAQASHDNTSVAELSYSLSENSDSALSINSQTGEIRLSENPDYEAKSSYAFTLIVTDTDGQTASQSLSIDVVDAIEGTDTDDSLIGLADGQLYDGGLGADTITYAKDFSEYDVKVGADGNVLVTDRNSAGQIAATDTLVNIETIQFADQVINASLAFNAINNEFQVNTYTDNNQYQPAVTALADGGFVVTWYSNGQDGSGYGIYGQRYDAQGAAVDNEFQVNTYTSSDQYQPAVTALADGGFVVTWYSNGQDGSGNGIYGQRYDAQGGAVDNEFQVNTYTSSDQSQPAVTALADGGFVVTWYSNGQDGSGTGIYGQRYDAQGAAVDNEFQVNTYTSSDQYQPAVTALADGGFVVTWVSNGQDGSGTGIYGQRYDAQGAAVNNEFQVNTYTSSDQYQPAVTALADGGFVVTWYSNGQDGSGTGIYGQRYDAQGAAVDNEFQVNTYTDNNQYQPAVTALADGGFVVTWYSNGQDGSGNGIYGQRYDAQGGAVNNEFQVNTYTSSDQYQPAVTALADGGFVVTWYSYGQDGSGYGIYGQRYDSSAQLVSGDIVWGGDQDDILVAAEGDQLLIGGAGDDVVDGGSGYNTYQVTGRADAFYWAVDSSGTIILTDLIVSADDAVDGSDEGVDQLANIQAIQFITPDGLEQTTLPIDDYSNAPDANNYQINYGEWVDGRTNFYGDVDYFNLDTVAGTAVNISMGDNSARGYIYFDGSASWINPWEDTNFAFSTTGQSTVRFAARDSNSDNPMRSYGYNFIVRRIKQGTNEAETIEAGLNYEWLEGGLGDDTLIGSDRSDVLKGGDGNDILQGGSGSDELFGDGGDANIALFSGNRADYHLEWTYSGNRDLPLTVTDNVANRDGSDSLHNIQILRFADGDLVLDAESNTPTFFDDYNIGEAIQGTLPVGVNSWDLDQDYFQLRFTSDITADTALRLRFESDTNADQGYITARFYMVNSEDVLTFTDLENNNNIDYFQIHSDQSNSWFISPSRFGSDSEFIARLQRIDLKIEGYVYEGAVGELADYSLQVDRVIFGTDSDDTLLGDGQAGFIDGRAGHDVIMGSALGEEIAGGSGDDELSGGAGNDLLVDYQGSNTLNGGEGDDVIDISGTQNPVAVIDGGKGIDTLKISSDTQWDNISLTAVEILDGNGGYTQLSVQAILDKGITGAKNIEFRLDPYASGGTLDITGLEGQVNLRGTDDSDSLIGNDQANRIYLNPEWNQSSYSNVTDNVSAGAGDDSIYRYLRNSDYNEQTNSYQINGAIDGGDGADTLTIIDNNWRNDYYLDLTHLELTQIEHLQIGIESNVASVHLSAEQLAALSSVSTYSEYGNTYSMPAIGITGGGAIDLAHINALGISNWFVADSHEYTITGGDQQDTIALGLGINNVYTYGGDDIISVDNKTLVQDSIDGGDGEDTLIIRGADVDLSGTTLINIESIRVSSYSLSMTESQWAAYGDLVTLVPGAITSFTLSLENPGNLTLAEDSVYVGYSGSAGDDVLVGNTLDNVLSGNAGNDVLQGLGGNDTLIAGAGVDNLQGGDGDDTLNVTGKQMVSDSLSGGEGTDTLVVTDGQDLTAANLLGLEILSGSGTVTMAASQLAQFTEIRAVNIQLVGDSSNFIMPDHLLLAQGASISLSSVDTELASYSGILGSASDDVIYGSQNNDTIHGGRGADYIAGGEGDDILIGGKGANTLVGDAGDDTLRVGGDSFSSGDQTRSGDILSGGEGDDSLIIDFNNKSNTRYELLDGSIQGIESLEVLNSQYSHLSLSAESWLNFSEVNLSSVADGAYWYNYNGGYYAVRLTITGSGEDINFSAVGSSAANRVDLRGSFWHIDLTNSPILSTNQDNSNDRLRISASFESLELSNGGDRVYIENDSAYSLLAGAGDDWIYQQGASRLTSQIDGGDGLDTFDVSNVGFIDLTATQFTNLENIYYGDSRIVLTEDQFSSLSLDGSGSVYIKIDGVIVGSNANDNFYGSGLEWFQGAAGDDYLNNINTAVFSGNYADYDYQRDGGQITVQHARGTLADGTDSLTNVLNMQFADTTVVLDDAPNESWNILQASNRDEQIAALQSVDYGKAVSATADYRNDNDVFVATLVPNSPLGIDASTANGSDWYFNFYDIETGNHLQFKSLVNGWVRWEYYSWMNPADKYVPGFETNNGFEAYQGGQVLVQVNINSSGDNAVEDYAFTLNYFDDYAGDTSTQGQMDPQEGLIRGYIGDFNDADWIRTDLIAGTKYEFQLLGQSSDNGTLVDPKLQLLNDQGQLIEAGIDQVDNVAGTDDGIIFRPTESGTYYLAASDVAGINTGSWTLTQSSLDTIAGNISTTERIEWSAANTFRIDSEINQLTDHDWFKVWLDKGMTYSFNLDGTTLGGTLSDPQLSLRSVTGRLLTQDDNSGEGSAAEIYYSAPDSGWYYLDAGASGNGYRGTYTLRGSSLADDYANSVFTEGMAVLGEQSTGLISYIGDSDWFKVGLSANTTYVIDLSGDYGADARLDPLRDPLVILRDESGNIIQRADDFNGSLDARAYFTPDASGLYFIEARSAFRYDIGAYSIDVSLAPGDDHSSVLDSSATAVTLGEDFSATVSGDIGIPGDKDVFQFDLEAGRVYLLQASGIGGAGGTLVDPYLRVFNSNGQLIDSDDDGGQGADAKFYFAPEQDGTYYLEVSSDNAKGMGTFELSVAQRNLPPDDAADNIGTQISLDPGDSFSGNLLTHNDEDWFAITLQAGEPYVFRAQASTSGNGTLNDPVLEVRGVDGALLNSVDNMLTSNEPALAFTPVSSGTYYLVVKAANGDLDTGTYLLTTREPDDHANNQHDATQITLDETLAGSIQWNDGSFGVRAIDSLGLATDFDEDWFTFTAQADEVISVNVELAVNSLMSRPMVEVVDSQGRVVSFGDGLETNNGLAIATFKAVDSGTYYARVIDGAGATGNYNITLTTGDASDEDANGPVALNFVTNGSVSEAVSVATIGLAGDTDSFEVVLKEDHSYRIETVAIRDGSFAPLPSAALTINWSAQGSDESEIVASGSDPMSPSFFDSAEFTANANGVLSLSVAPLEATQTGRYQLRVIDLGADAADDYSDTVTEFDANNGSLLAINENAQGKIDDSEDRDLFAVNLTTGNIYDFSIKSYTDGLGTLSQAEVRLINEAGQLVSVGSYDSEAGRTELSVSVFNSGRYFVEVSAANITGNRGTYTLDTSLRNTDETVIDDISADTQSGVMVAPGMPATGEIETAGDHDWIAVNLEAGKVYIVDLLADGHGAGGTLADGTLRIIDNQGNSIAYDDNGGAANDARIQITPPASGEYFIDVASRYAETGTYTLRVRELYSGVADPLEAAQWYLDNAGVYELNGAYTGAGVTIGVVDDGIDSTHPDLQANINFAAAYDTQFDTNDGTPKYPVFAGYPDNHGTLVAGIIAAEANNETGIRGIAPDAELASTRVKWSWDQMVQALSLQWQFDVSNNSWGATTPFGDNFNSTALTFGWVALRKGVEEGRDGLGTNFVFSAGNSAGTGDNTNYHNFQNAREVITVGAANADGSMAGFSTPGANVLVSSYGTDMMTTDRHQAGWGANPSSDYYANFSGTSAAAPMISGIVALMLEANPNLGYRDVQKILAYSTTHSELQDWKENGASDWNLGGLKYNDKAGFGLVDAYTAVQLARTWTDVNTSINEVSASARQFGMFESIPDGTGSTYAMSFDIDSSLSVEHVELGVDLRHERLGDLIITLTSPDGTVSTLLDRPTVNSERPFGLSGQDSGVPSHLLWDFSSVQFYGEEAAGTWTVNVTDVRPEHSGTLHSLSLRIYGERDDGNDTYIFTDEGFAQQSSGLLEDEYGEDTINAAAVRFDALIDLHEGIIAANATTHGIASWSVIERAVSGSGDDSLVGNSQDNYLDAGSGDDVLRGGEGDDILMGGAGSDTALYAGSMAEYSIAWDPDAEVLTVIDTKLSNGDDGTDSLSGIERIVFDDGELNLAETVGNRPPQANSSYFEDNIQLQSGMGIDYQLPDDAFTDEDGESIAEMEITVSDAAGGELPEWLSYDPASGTFSGVPPQSFLGVIKLKVEAVDEFGESASDILTLQFGDNQAPIIDNPVEVVVNEDAGLVALGLTQPEDPEGTEVTVEITEIPVFGPIIDKSGNAVSVGAIMTADEFTELHYQTSLDQYGDAGYLRFKATDEDAVSSQSSVHLFVDPVNDAPRFATESNVLVIQYPDQATVALDMLQPMDPESQLTSVRVSELPQLGLVTLDNQPLSLDQVLTFDQLERLQFTLDQNVNGPIGAVGIQAVDPEGQATNWSLSLEVQGDSEFNTGTSGVDELYGSISDDVLYGRSGNDTLVGNAGDDRLLGGLGNDFIFGGSGNDQLDGSAGNDYLDGGSGSDFMAGGPGHDTYIFDGHSDIALEVISGGAGGKDVIISSVSLTAPDNIENLEAVSGVTIDLQGNELDNNLLGNNENNLLQGLSGRDWLFGEGGDDTLDGGLGVDTLVGGLGDDIYYVDSKAERVSEQQGQGIDKVFASASYTLSSNVENLQLQEGGNFTAGGNSLDNHLTGNSGNNLLAGGLGADILEGGLGDDIYVLSDSLDTIIDTGGIDTIRSNQDIVLINDIENADLVGVSDSVATGNGLDNLLSGNMADNILDGLGGVDTLTGGQGSDTFILASNGEDVEADLITDFHAGEDLAVIDLLSFDVSPELLGLLSSGLVSEDAFVSGAGAAAMDPNDHYLHDTAQGVLKFDVDGSGDAEAIVVARIQLDDDSDELGAGDVFVGI